MRDHKDWPPPLRHSRQSSFERQRPRRHADSWDEEDDYEYDEERSVRYHWPECHGPRELEKERSGVRERDWMDDRRHYRRKEIDWEKYCCPDWERESEEMGKSIRAMLTLPVTNEIVADHRYRWSYRKYGSDRYYGRWEDDQEDPQQHYLTTKPRNWKQRPSSASEMDRKSGENKNWAGQHYMGTGKLLRFIEYFVCSVNQMQCPRDDLSEVVSYTSFRLAEDG